MKSITVAMPALNEEANVEHAIKNVLSAFDSLKIDGEVVVVNDGSSDGTQAAIDKCVAKEPARVKTLGHTSPQGIGASFWDGAMKASKDSVVMMPGDGENDAVEILRYMQLMDHVDIIVPYVVNKNVRDGSRNLISGLFLFIINMTFGLNLNYTNGTVVYKRALLEGLAHREKGFFYQVEALIKCIKKGALYAEVPYVLSTRSTGKSKAISFKSLKNVMAGYLNLVKDVYFSQEYKR